MQFGLTGIVIENPSISKKRSFRKWIELIFDRTIFTTISKAWLKMLDYYGNKFTNFPNTPPITEVQKINSEETVDFIKSLMPDLLVVSGTSILKEKILSLSFPKGIVNLHTGLSPYIKGGPNCTNRCISKGWFHKIGNTIMWIDAGIDSGDIITTEQTLLIGDESLSDIHIKVMEHAHDLYCRAIKKIETDFDECKHIKQATIDKGVTFYSKSWNWKNKFRLIKNLKRMKNYIQSSQYEEDLKKVQVIEL